jgi:hypothetical protein
MLQQARVWGATGIRDLWVVENQAESIDVCKHGAQTQLTRGDLMPAAADHFMEDVRARYTSGWWAYGIDGAFAAPGDSGAIVVDDERRVVGMVVAVDRPGEDAAAFVHGIRQIFTALEIALP